MAIEAFLIIDYTIISLGKARSVSTNLFMLRELLSDDSKLHSAKHVD